VSPGCILHASGLLNSTGALIVQVQDTQQIIREQLPWFKKISGLQDFFPSPCGWTYVGFCTCDTECAKGVRHQPFLPLQWHHQGPFSLQCESTRSTLFCLLSQHCSGVVTCVQVMGDTTTNHSRFLTSQHQPRRQLIAHRDWERRG
jgi:hypothetical protein